VAILFFWSFLNTININQVVVKVKLMFDIKEVQIRR